MELPSSNRAISSLPPGDRKPSPQMICRSASMLSSYSPGSLKPPIFGACRLAHEAPSSASRALAPYTCSSASRMIAGCTAMARFFAASNQ